MRQAQHGIYVVCLTFAVLLPQSANAQQKAILPRWRSDNVYRKRLAPAVKIEEYNIRPPKNYKVKQPPENAPGGAKLYVWVGATRKDGITPTLLAMFFAPPKSEIQKYTLEQLSDKFLIAVRRRREEWKQKKAEYGLVNGLTFCRIRWSGVEPYLKRKMQGFIYLTRIGDTLIELDSQEVWPEAKQALPLAEAAALTFKKQ